MTLRRKLFLLSVLSKALMAAVLLLALPWVVQLLALRHTDSRLHAEMRQVEARIRQVGIAEFLPGALANRRAHYDLLQDEFIALRPFFGPARPDAIMTVSHRQYMGTADFRVLYHDLRHGGQQYALEIGKSIASVEEVYDLLRSLARYALAGAVLLTLLLEFGVLNRLLLPVEAIVARLRSVQGPLPPVLAPLDTTTADFRYLDLGLRQMLDRIRAGHEQERQFIAHASHELLTPIAVLQTRFENMLAAEAAADRLPEAAEVQLVASQKTLHRLTATLRTLLLISRIENQQFARPETVVVGDVLADVLTELEDLIADRGLTIHGLAPAALVLPHANRELFFTLLYNLLSNAIKYNVAGGTIYLSGTVNPPDGETTVRIRNTGPGIPSAQLAHIFERFHRADATGLVEGHGLGLALARAIAQLHAMSLTLESAADTGTTATLRWRAAPKA
ncbi:MAG: HAMP domain-containing histidine kinase [Hymenobacteraceae bacterium]|nr:HAMP domain-containing histidine kinase [Hymenobacteraceae bacterium]